MKIAVIHFGRLAHSNEIASNLDENEQNLLNLNIQAAKEGADLIVNPEASILPFYSKLGVSSLDRRAKTRVKILL